MCGINSNLPSQRYIDIETTQLICFANQLTGFNVGLTLACYGLTTSIDMIEAFVLVSFSLTLNSFRAIISLIIKPFHAISKHLNKTLSNETFPSFWYLPIFFTSPCNDPCPSVLSTLIKKHLPSSTYPIVLEPFNCQFHKMVKHTQTIRRQIPDELFECVWPFCGIGAY